MPSLTFPDSFTIISSEARTNFSLAEVGVGYNRYYMDDYFDYNGYYSGDAKLELKVNSKKNKVSLLYTYSYVDDSTANIYLEYYSEIDLDTRKSTWYTTTDRSGKTCIGVKNTLVEMEKNHKLATILNEFKTGGAS